MREQNSNLTAFVWARSSCNVHDEPATVLTEWRIMRVCNLGANGKRTLHLTGSTPKTNGRVTTELVSCEMTRMQATTSSGRVYLLAGEPSDGNMAEIAITVWLRAEGKVVKHEDVTFAILRLRKLKLKRSCAGSTNLGLPSTPDA